MLCKDNCKPRQEIFEFWDFVQSYITDFTVIFLHPYPCCLCPIQWGWPHQASPYIDPPCNSLVGHRQTGCIPSSKFHPSDCYEMWHMAPTAVLHRDIIDGNGITMKLIMHWIFEFLMEKVLVKRAPEQNGCYLVDNIFKCVFMKENYLVLIQISQISFLFLLVYLTNTTCFILLVRSLYKSCLFYPCERPSFNSSPPWAKWPPFCRWYFQMHFCEWKILYFE